MVRLRAGDEAAAAEIFEHFSRDLIRLARRRLGARIGSKEDPEDVLQSVFKSFFRRQAAGQFEVENWNSLWGLLTVITLRKCGHRVDYFRAARRDVHREVSCQPSPDQSAAVWEAMARGPTPVEAACLTETIEQLMIDLNPRDRRILELSLQGESVPDISAEVGVSARTVERVQTRIRLRLEEMQADPDE